MAIHNISDVSVAGAVEKITKGTAFLQGTPCRAICCGTSGTFNFTDAAGNVLTNYPLQQGYNPISVASVQASGTADDIWALF